MKSKIRLGEPLGSLKDNINFFFFGETNQLGGIYYTMVREKKLKVKCLSCWNSNSEVPNIANLLTITKNGKIKVTCQMFPSWLEYTVITN